MSAGPLHGQSEKKILTNGTRYDHLHSGSGPAAQDESECAQGDLLNGVGSASSTSTVSSIFSMRHPTINIAHANNSRKSTSVTPLTNLDSSPPSNAPDLHQTRASRDDIEPGRKLNRSPLQLHAKERLSLISPLHIQLAHPTQARPGRGEAKGLKLTYDPYLDKKLSSEKRHNSQVQYEAFGNDVSLMVTVTANDSTYVAVTT